VLFTDRSKDEEQPIHYYEIIQNIYFLTKVALLRLRATLQF